MTRQEEHEAKNVAVDTAVLHLLPPREAMRVFDDELGSGSTWSSPLMQYRTTARFQEDWKVEVGNWLERARRLGFLDDARRKIIPHQHAAGDRAAGDGVHRKVVQQLAQAMLVHYLVGTGWGFRAWEPVISEKRGSGIRADVDVQLAAPDGTVVDFQVKASGELGLADSVVDDHTQKGIRKAAGQLPAPANRPALIAVLSQRSWPLTSNIDVVEHFIGHSCEYADGAVLLRDKDRGEFLDWPHVGGILILDHRRGPSDSDYGCVMLQNPWAAHPVASEWFAHTMTLTHSETAFRWIGGHPAATTFPDGTTSGIRTMMLTACGGEGAN